MHESSCIIIKGKVRKIKSKIMHELSDRNLSGHWKTFGLRFMHELSSIIIKFYLWHASLAWDCDAIICINASDTLQPATGGVSACFWRRNASPAQPHFLGRNEIDSLWRLKPSSTRLQEQRALAKVVPKRSNFLVLKSALDLLNQCQNPLPGGIPELTLKRASRCNPNLGFRISKLCTKFRL